MGVFGGGEIASSARGLLAMTPCASSPMASRPASGPDLHVQADPHEIAAHGRAAREHLAGAGVDHKTVRHGAEVEWRYSTLPVQRPEQPRLDAEAGGPA